MKNKIFMILGFLIYASSAIALPFKVMKPDKNVSKVSFDEIYSRYPSPFAVIYQLERIFPYADKSYSQCTIFDEETSSLGINDPMLGMPLEKEPGALFYQYFQNCIRYKAVFFENSSNFERGLQEIFDEEETVPLFKKFRHDLRVLWRTNWDSDLSTKEQDLILKQFIFYLVGPDQLLREMKYIGKDNIFGISLESSSDLAKFFRENIIIQNESSKTNWVRDFYVELAIILRLGPALKD